MGATLFRTIDRLSYLDDYAAILSCPNCTADERLFAAERPGNALERLAVELPQMFAAADEEEGFFIMIGRKRPITVTPQAPIQMSHSVPV